MYQPPKNELSLQDRFFSSHKAQRSLQDYVQELRSLSASIGVGTIPEHIKVPTFLNVLRHGPARQTFSRKVPSTMKEAIGISLVEEQFYNSGNALAKAGRRKVCRHIDGAGHRRRCLLQLQQSRPYNILLLCKSGSQRENV